MSTAGRILLLWVLSRATFPGGASAQAYRTPRAGEAYTGVVLGRPFVLEERDRRRVSALYGGAVISPAGAEGDAFSPQGAVYLWRNPGSGAWTLRATLLGLYDDVRHTRRLSAPFEAVVSFENTTSPWARADRVEGRRIDGEELRWSMLRAGLGAGLRIPLAPHHQDNALQAALTYEAGGLLFRRASGTSPSFREPGDVYEGRVHLRARADALERNLLERPHSGWAAGLDAIRARRAGPTDWGGGPTGPHAAADGRTWSALSAYALAAFPLPFVNGSRHRVLASAYAGTGSDLDRFSAFRLSGGTNSGDFESLATPVYPAAAFDEIASRGYLLASVEYRWEVFFFLYLHAIGTFGHADRARSAPDGGIAGRTDSFGAVTLGITSGFLWSSTVEVFLSRNGGLERRPEGGPATAGRSALFVSVTKAF